MDDFHKKDDTLSSDVETSSLPLLQKKTSTFKLGFCQISVFWAKIFFAFCAVTGQVGQNVSLPLWIDSTIERTSGPTVDSYFVLSFANILFVVIFGVAIKFIQIFWPNEIGETEKKAFPHRLVFLVGFCDAWNDCFIIFASKGSRTPPYLQAILGNFMIPLTIVFRFFILRRKPTPQKLLCGLSVVLGLFICLIPTIFTNIDPEAGERTQRASGVSGVMWPIIFMLAWIPAALMNVLEEKGLKMQDDSSEKGINVTYFLFWTNTYQLLVVVFIFWADILPWFGDVTNFTDLGKNWWYGARCFFGGAGCDATSGSRGIAFVILHILSHAGAANLLRHTEGATWLAIVMSLVTPLGFLFWTLFNETPFMWQPECHVSTWFSIGALAIMVPAIYLYNVSAPEISLDSDESKRNEVISSSFFNEVGFDNPREPLLGNGKPPTYTV